MPETQAPFPLQNPQPGDRPPGGPTQPLDKAIQALMTGPDHTAYGDPAARRYIDILASPPAKSAGPGLLGEVHALRGVQPTAPVMDLSERGADFIKSFEQGPHGDGAALEPYGSLEGGTQTVGWGHKIKSGEQFSAPLTQDQADDLFYQDVQPALAKVRSTVEGPISQNQFDALVSLAFNDPKAFRNPTFARALKSGDYAAAADQMLTFDTYRDPKTGASIPVSGLSVRRAAERDILMNNHYYNHR